ncbi:MAG TPA: hypothetical protein PK514_10425 [Spirochaetota bacterium]|nr:hypothetical protein [Spirochaetota bacterium]
MVDSSNLHFVKVKGNSFILNENTYCFIGTNLWYGMNLGSQGPGGNRERLVKELDILQYLGITNLRIMAGSEGPDSEPWRIIPSIQASPGEYNPELLDGLDFLLSEMDKRNMKAVLCLTNFWEWSGGMAQYVSWHGGGPIPYPNIRKEWRTFQKYTACFFSNRESINCLNNYIRLLINRMNNYTKKLYRDDPVIMSWQLCNEARGIHNEFSFNRWIDETAALIKSLDKNHLVSTGTEGETPYRHVGLDFIKNNSYSSIDYMTAHLWVQNWNIYKPEKHHETFNESIKFAIKYIDEHIDKAERLGKPLVLEEFGFPRDNGLYSPDSPTEYRDQFYDTIFKKITGEITMGRTAGCLNFWAWSGTGRPSEPYGSYWQPDCDLLGDPPHELQGWYGVYNGDTTLEIIKKYSSMFIRPARLNPREIQ